MKSETNDIYEMLDTLNCLKALNSAAIPLCSSFVKSWSLST